MADSFKSLIVCNRIGSFHAGYYKGYNFRLQAENYKLFLSLKMAIFRVFLPSGPVAQLVRAGDS